MSFASINVVGGEFASHASARECAHVHSKNSACGPDECIGVAICKEETQEAGALQDPFGVLTRNNDSEGDGFAGLQLPAP